jgi:catechol 2,3-dioxygenase-like lactoylglutathione lyase family enzyme
MPRGLDHLVLASHDLAAQAAFYRALGFMVGARNRHDWGTLNHIVQFDGCFLELIGLEPAFAPPAREAPVAQFAGFLADYLSRREGFAMLVLESGDAAADQAAFAAAGIAGPSTFRFARTGKRPDGTDIHLAFSLAFARTPAAPDAGFFVCQQHNPENFWNPAFQMHANTVTSVAAVTLVAADPRALAPFLAAYCGAEPESSDAGAVVFVTPRGRIEVMTPSAFRAAYGADTLPVPPPGPELAAVRFAAQDLAAVRRHLDGALIPHSAHQNAVVVAPTAAFGTVLAFAGGAT